MTDCELYIHIPFCVRKCFYCDFASYENSLDMLSDYISLLSMEASWMAERFSNYSFTSIYVGGGTPSLVSPYEWKRLFTLLSQSLDLSNVEEFTSEANPDSLSEQWLDAAISTGVNRISMGMQSALDTELQSLGRIHSQSQTEKAIEMVHSSGINNLNLDLMFGYPGQTLASWKRTLSCALSFSPTHVSTYGLIPEEGTVMNNWINGGKVVLPDEDTDRAMYDLAKDILKSSGYIQYEISNFSKKGYECHHNIGYWNSTPYLGLGCSSASMFPVSNTPFSCERYTNPRSLPAYQKMIESRNTKLRETEYVSPVDARFESVMLGLRMITGIDENAFEKRHGISLVDCYGEKLLKQEKLGYIKHKEGHWRLTDKGLDCQNAVLVELME